MQWKWLQTHLQCHNFISCSVACSLVKILFFHYFSCHRVVKIFGMSDGRETENVSDIQRTPEIYSKLDIFLSKSYVMKYRKISSFRIIYFFSLNTSSIVTEWHLTCTLILPFTRKRFSFMSARVSCHVINNYESFPQMSIFAHNFRFICIRMFKIAEASKNMVNNTLE